MEIWERPCAPVSLSAPSLRNAFLILCSWAGRRSRWPLRSRFRSAWPPQSIEEWPIDSFVRFFASWLAKPFHHFRLGVLLVLIFAVNLRLLPTSGTGGVAHLVLPCVTLAFLIGAGLVRIVRAAMLESLTSEFIQVARAKGLPEHQVVWRHALLKCAVADGDVSWADADLDYRGGGGGGDRVCMARSRPPGVRCGHPGVITLSPKAWCSCGSRSSCSSILSSTVRVRCWTLGCERASEAQQTGGWRDPHDA